MEATAEDALAWELCAVDADPSEACLLKRWKDKLLALSLALPLPRKEIRSVGIISEMGAHSVPQNLFMTDRKELDEFAEHSTGNAVCDQNIY